MLRLPIVSGTGFRRFKSPVHHLASALFGLAVNPNRPNDLDSIDRLSYWSTTLDSDHALVRIKLSVCFGGRSKRMLQRHLDWVSYLIRLAYQPFEAHWLKG